MSVQTMAEMDPQLSLEQCLPPARVRKRKINSFAMQMV